MKEERPPAGVIGGDANAKIIGVPSKEKETDHDKAGKPIAIQMQIGKMKPPVAMKTTWP
jgi:hypothetical protein